MGRGFESDRKIIFALGVILLLYFVLADCGKKSKVTSKKENAKTSSSRKKNDLDLEPEPRERRFFQEDAFGQPKKYVESEEFNPDNKIYRPPQKTAKSLPSYLGSTPGCKNGNCKNGSGVYVYDTGEVYSGSFKNDKRHGYGDIQYQDGDRYSGYFQNDKKAGRGTYRFVNGSVFNGRFYDDGESAEGYLTIGKKRKECSIIRNKLNCHG
ncbi:hypothetical protein [Leptospira borgpetersenii]|uniref:hypothetical protein n=1 Tax=Leptospira borgpetersenii TaxID=174 RepID=UPI000773633B|nr:hypothetical protein [Leptospira borgpetersenii]